MPVVSHLPVEILDYIATHAPPEDEAFGISQHELAKALGYHPSSMSRPLASLVRAGQLRCHRGVVRGGLRKQLVYSLTDEGKAALERQTRDVPLLSGALPPPPNPFFGRRTELRQLSTVAGTGGCVVFVSGPGGIGKTALVSRHIRKLREGRVPFWFTVRGGSSPRHLTLALAHAISPIGGHQLAYYAQLPRPPKGREVADIAQRALGDLSLLCVFDDFQSSNEDMRAFLVDFADSFGRRPSDLFFFVGQEPPFFTPKGLPLHELTLGGLDRAAAHELTDRRGGLADRFEPVFRSTMGSPLLLQLAVTSPGVEATASALPTAVVGRLSHEEVGALLPVALANEPIPESLVLEGSSIPVERIVQWVQSGLLYRAGEGRVELLEVVRGALLTRVSTNEERAAHLKLATFYSRSHRPESVRERFLHLVAGESWKDADRVIQSQERNLLALGYSDPFRNALRHLTLAAPKGPPRVRALRTEAALLRLHSEYLPAVLSLRRAAAESDRDPRTEAECLHAIVELYVRLRQIEEARAALEEAKKHAPESRRMAVYSVLSQARIDEIAGDPVAARTGFQASFTLAKRGHQPDLALEAIAALSRLASLGGDPKETLRVVEDGLVDARAAGRLDIVFNLLLVRARVHAQLGRIELADSEMRMIRAEAESLGYLSQLTYTLSGLAAMTAEASRWADSLAFAKQASALAERLGNDVVLGHTLAIMGKAELAQGQLDEALHHGERAVAILSGQPPTDSMPFAEAYLAETYLALGRKEEARRCYSISIEQANSMGMLWWRDLVQKELDERLGGESTEKAHAGHVSGRPESDSTPESASSR